ncbi:hypothetical protein FPV67DRAFT_1769133 [Lyophyllum atratum]|nr:hypothetical protein FPV67DRAFT_1769133 [Lyophyllum atratum]
MSGDVSEKLTGPGIRRRDHATVEDGNDEERQRQEDYDRLPSDSPNEKSRAGEKQKKEKEEKWTIPEDWRWIPDNLNYTGLKPVIRSAIAAWIGLVLFVIPRVQLVLGKASYIILLASAISPPSEPFLMTLEREVLVMSFATLSWAWCCLGITLANLTRHYRNPAASPTDIIHGRYIETAPTIILGVWIFLGSSFFLFIRAHQGPGPYLFACVFACILLNISLTQAALYPYPFYLSGKAVVIPLVFHSAIALVASIFVFPSTISARFTTNLQAVLTPLIKALELHQSILRTSPYAPDFAEKADQITAQIGHSDTALTHMAATARLLPSDVIYARYAPHDFLGFQDLARRLAARGNGMGVYFSLIHPTRARFPATPAPSGVGTPNISRTTTQQPTQREGSMRSGQQSPARSSHSQQQQQHHHHHHFDLHRHLHQNILRRAFHPRQQRTESAVGVFESQRYMDLEAERFNDPYAEVYTEQTTQNLSASCHNLIDGCRGGLQTIRDWLGHVRDGRMRYLMNTRETIGKWEKQLAEHEKVREGLAAALERFRREERHRVLDPYRPGFDQSGNENGEEAESDHELPAHRYLFQAFVYQFHLIQFTNLVLEMLDEMIRLQKERKAPRLWHPARAIEWWKNWEPAEDAAQGEDEDPDKIQGLDQQILDDLGMPQRRDPDAMPPRNMFEQVMSMVYYSFSGLAGGNVLFAMKAGVLTGERVSLRVGEFWVFPDLQRASSVLLSLPSLLKSSAYFAYSNKFVWGIVMGQVTIARFQGDTAFVFLVRILSTFLGGLMGMVMWYISCGGGNGNPYGLAAVGAVCFPFLFFVRVHWPGKPLTIIVFLVTCMLVIGYSYQDIIQPGPGTQGFGWSVAWRRFVLVAAGVFAAFLFSWLPPAKTLRRYTRHILSTTSNELGAIYCAIIGYAYTPREKDVHEINLSLLAVRSKLRRTTARRANVIYEVSLRGRWPAERYHKLFEIQLQLTYSLSHLMAVYHYLEPAWARALLRRTKFLDTDFQGDILAVITMISTALRAGSPLPQITPCPLLDRFMEQAHGLDIIHKESEEDYGLPRTLTLDTLRNEQYMYFSVGVSTSYGLVTRLDRLMVAAKEIVGEQYHIHGIGIGPTYSRGFDSDMGRRTAIHFGSPQEV